MAADFHSPMRSIDCYRRSGEQEQEKKTMKYRSVQKFCNIASKENASQLF